MTQVFTFLKYLSCLFLVCGMGIFPLVAQHDQALRAVTNAYAITGATIIPSPGQKIEKGTVVVKNGLIVAVGKDVAIPADAIKIKADSMFVYAGFIDGFSHTGVALPKNDKTEKVKYPGNPPPDRAGITPQRDVRNFINASDKSITELRDQGFGVAQVVPHGNLLPGQAAIVLLSGEEPDRMTLLSRSAMYSELSGTPGIYPTTIMGVMAKWRELYRQAVSSKSYEAMYAANPSGLERPASNQELESFYPVIDRRQSVLFKADNIMDIQRVIALKNDLGFQMSMGDVKEAWPIISKVKNSGANVFLSLSLPPEVKKDKTNTDTTSEERQALERRKAEAIANHEAQASAFAKAGIRFGFSANSVQPKDIRTNLRRMIAAGLTEDAALAALTTSPAQMLGLSTRLGTIERGKIANLVITDQPFFAEKAKVRYMFVEGKMHATVEAPKSVNGKKADIKGSWSYLADTPQGKGGGKLVIKENGGNYSGTITNNFSGQETSVNDISLIGSALSFNYTIDAGGSTIKIEVSATVNGNSFDGSMTAGQYGTFPMNAKKDPM